MLNVHLNDFLKRSPPKCSVQNEQKSSLELDQGQNMANVDIDHVDMGPNNHWRDSAVSAIDLMGVLSLLI